MASYMKTYATKTRQFIYNMYQASSGMVIRIEPSKAKAVSSYLRAPAGNLAALSTTQSELSLESAFAALSNRTFCYCGLWNELERCSEYISKPQ